MQNFILKELKSYFASQISGNRNLNKREISRISQPLK